MEINPQDDSAPGHIKRTVRATESSELSHGNKRSRVAKLPWNPDFSRDILITGAKRRFLWICFTQSNTEVLPPISRTNFRFPCMEVRQIGIPLYLKSRQNTFTHHRC